MLSELQRIHTQQQLFLSVRFKVCSVNSGNVGAVEMSLEQAVKLSELCAPLQDVVHPDTMAFGPIWYISLCSARVLSLFLLLRPGTTLNVFFTRAAKINRIISNQSIEN